MTDEKKRETIANYLDAYNVGDVEGMLVLLTPDVRFENHFNGELNASASGARELREVAALGMHQFQRREQRLVGLQVEADRAVAQIEFIGMLTRDLPEGSIAGTELHLQGTSEFTFAGDLIASIIDRSSVSGRQGHAPVS